MIPKPLKVEQKHDCDRCIHKNVCKHYEIKKTLESQIPNKFEVEVDSLNLVMECKNYVNSNSVLYR